MPPTPWNRLILLRWSNRRFTGRPWGSELLLRGVNPPKLLRFGGSTWATKMGLGILRGPVKLKDPVKKIKDLAKLKDLCGKGNAWTPRAGDHGRKGLTNEITRG